MLISRSLLLPPLILIAPAALACDFCMLGQGVSPYMTSEGRGVTIDTVYTESDRVYNGHTEVPGQNLKEGWLVESLTAFGAVTSNLTVLATMPYVSKSNFDYDAASNATPGVLVDGVGDATISGRYSLLSSHTLTSTAKLGATFGLKLPTGKTDERDVAGEPVDRHALPGTGSVDYVLGINSAFAFAGLYQVTADVVYDWAGKGKWAGDEHRYGNAVNYSLEGYVKVYPGEPSGTSYFVFTGLSGETIGKEYGVRDDDGYHPDEANESSGGTVGYWDFGLYATFEASTILNLGYSRAVYHRMNYSTAFDPDPAENYKLRMGLTRLF